MRKIDPATIDLSKLAVSETGIPIGFRELLPEDTVQNGDIYDSHSGEWGGNFGERWRVQKCAQRLEAGRGYYGPPENGWLKHYRLLDVPFNVPEGYGRVTGGTTKKGDIVADKWSRAVCAPYEADHDYPVGCANVGSYRLQPAFSAKNTQPDYCDVTGFQTKKQFVFDRDYKSGCDKLQAKVDALTKRLREKQTTLGVRTEQLEAEQARSGDLRYVVNTLQQDLRDVRYALLAAHQEIERLEDRRQFRRPLGNSVLSFEPKDSGVGEGYRELHDAELPTARDEFSFAPFLNVPRIWSYRGWPSTGLNETYGNLKRELGAGLQYRRKLNAF